MNRAIALLRPLAHPLPAGSFRASSPFGQRIDPISGATAGHNGADYAAPTGTPVSAAAAGRVAALFRDHPLNGNAIVISHDERPGGVLSTSYVHLSRIDVRQGERVKRGERIGAVGSTGRSTGPHLHFVVTTASGAADPARYVSAPTSGGGGGGVPWWGWALGLATAAGVAGMIWGARERRRLQRWGSV